MQIKRRTQQDHLGHSSALNDILFILLLFFLIISTLANPNVVKLSIPKAKSDTKAKQTVVVSIDGKQQFFVGTHAVSVDSLKNTLSGAIAKSQDAEPTVVI
jgi:biopolymer transport protein ExbD